MDKNSTGFFGAVSSWIASPFNTQGSALRWVLFVGLIIIAVWFWNVILIDLSKQVSEV